MQLTHDQAQELKALSKEVFGSSSRWQKLVEKGYSELVTEEKDEEMPAEPGQEPKKQKVQVPVLNKHGMKQYVVKHHTVESVTVFMKELKARRDAIMAEIKKLQEEKAQKEAQNRLTQDVQQQAAGSVMR